MRVILRWAAWGIRCLLGWPTTIAVPILGVRLYLLPQWRGCWKGIYVFRQRWFEVSEPELEFLKDLLKPGDIFIDAGAFHGWYTLLASRGVGTQGQVLAFEPNPDSFGVLKRNIDLNGCRNVRAFNVALSNAEERRWLYKGPNDGSQSSLAPVAGGIGRQEVRTRRLDDVMDELCLRRIDVMKIDVQGAEATVLEGATGVLQSSSPVIIFELAPGLARDMGLSERGVWDLLAVRGYRFYRLAKRRLQPLTDFPTLLEGQYINIIAIPGQREFEPRRGGLQY
ncbi:MAG: FkbM family methyltransferase [Armatimonadota bacterium]|nr:FkbM family methyltransferase [Armatimonadota bacterium]